MSPSINSIKKKSLERERFKTLVDKGMPVTKAKVYAKSCKDFRYINKMQVIDYFLWKKASFT